MRIYEFAKDLDIKSQKIIDLLADTPYKVTSHNSGIDDKAQNYIKNKIKKEEERKTEHMNNNEEKSEERVQDAQVERPKKKSSISAVFNPQNSKQNSAKKTHTISSKSSADSDKEKTSKAVENKKEESQQIKEKSSGRENVQKIEKEMPMKEVVEQKDEKVSMNKPAENSTRSTDSEKSTNQSTGTRRPYQDRNTSNNGERRPYQDRNSSNSGERRPYGDRNNTNNGERRPYGDRNTTNNGERRPYGDRNTTNNGDRRPYGDRNTTNNGERRPYGDRNTTNNGERRPYGDRNTTNNGERRPYGDRNNTNNGERRPYGDRNNTNNGERRPYGDRNNTNNGERRPYGDRNTSGGDRRPYGDRNSNGGDRRPYGDRRNSSNQGDGKLDQEINKFNKDSTKATPDEMRTKESREKKERKPVKKVQNYSKKPKKQENYVNLEKQSGHKKRQQTPQPAQKVEEEIRTIVVPEHLTLKELAEKMKLQASMIVKKLFLKGQMVTVNQEITYEMAEEIALEFNCITEPEVKVDVIEELLKEEDDDASTLVPRPAVVCVMGHVDHGKTSLLDAIRSTHVTDREAGGITQHIGASVVSINNQTITFLDTPGHEAFTAMRMRGANSTDIAILVVAADDGVMPQTIEAINHAKAAGIEIIVAINKIDKPSANIERVKQELSEYELIPEDWGGSTIFVPVSAHTGDGIKQLLEMILLTAEVSELKANPNRKARGVIIEAQLDKGRGAVATVLIQKGTLNIGEPVACGSAYGKVRAMVDDKGHRVKEAGPSTPVEIIGLSSVPVAGETFIAMESEKEARSFAETYVSEGRERLIEETKSRMSLDDLFSQIKSGNVKELGIIVKADVQGSVEAVKQSLNKLSNEEVMVKVIHGGVGAINESDVILASASNAIIIGFNVRPDPQAKMTAEREGVDLRLYKVIYNAIEDVAAAMKGMLDPIFEEKVLGHAEIRQLFQSSGVGTIAGSYILDGTFERGCKVRVSREGTQIFEGDLASLKRFKDDVKEVRTGYECGLVFDGFNEVQELDIVEAYKMVEVPR